MAGWSELLAEYRQLVVGPMLEAEVRDVAIRISRRYPPSVYATSGDWIDAVDDLVNDVIVALVANDGEQLNYVMGVADSISDFRGLVGKHVHRVLSHGRKRTLVDNLLDRSRKILAREPFKQVGILDGRDAYGLRDDAMLSAPLRTSLRHAALLVSKVPKQRRPDGDRAWMVWSTPSLEIVLRTIACSLPTAFTEREVAAVFEDALTIWIPNFLEADVNAEEVADYAWSDAEIADAEATATRVLEAMDSEELRAIALWQAGWTHEEIAAELACSRPTAAGRIDHGTAYLRAQIELLAPNAQRLAVDFVSLALDRDHVPEVKSA